VIRCEPATPADYPSILALNQTALPAVSPLNEPDLIDLHQQSVQLTVARAGDEMAGFMLILKEGANYGSPNYRYFADRYDVFHYVDRIVVNADFRRQGVGATLYRSLFEAATDAPRVTCEVNVRPPNPGSLAFHESLGFVVVGEQDTDGGKKRVALMVREADEG
jgi:predicted GNAT superfamily acetyltransferase